MRHTNMKVLTTRQVSKYIPFTPRTIARWCREGHVEGAKKHGRVWLIPFETVRKMLS